MRFSAPLGYLKIRDLHRLGLSYVQMHLVIQQWRGNTKNGHTFPEILRVPFQMQSTPSLLACLLHHFLAKHYSGLQVVDFLVDNIAIDVIVEAVPVHSRFHLPRLTTLQKPVRINISFRYLKSKTMHS